MWYSVENASDTGRCEYAESERGMSMNTHFCHYDVLVVGGGPSGVAAAISAARNGANTLLVEKDGFLGGMSTAGLLNVWCGYAT